MKKLATLLIAAGLVFGATAPAANAIDFKAKGEWVMSFDYGQNGNFTGGHGQTGYNGKEDEFEAKQRLRLQLDAVASENLSGTVFFEIGNTTWGQDSSGGALGADKQIVEVRRAYIDWMVPNTELKVRMGLQGMNIPSFTMNKSQVFEDDVAGITLSYQFTDNVGATAFWARPYNDNFAGWNGYHDRSDNANFMDNIDAFGLLIPLTFDGIKVTPWGMIAAIGPNALREVFSEKDEFGNVIWTNNHFGNTPGTSTSQMLNGLLPAWGVAGTGADFRNPNGNALELEQYATAWWAGVTADITYFDPFRIAFDFMGGGVQWDDSRLNRAGWMAALLVEYKMDWGIPGILGWYASGDNSNLGDGSERLPYLSLGNGDNQFSNFAFDGHPYIAREGVLGPSMAGTWGVGLRVRDMSFIEDLKHTFRVNLIGGTNDHGIFRQLAKGAATVAGYPVNNNGDYGFKGLYLTDQDTALEISLHNEYKMYENFTIMLDASYIALWLEDTKYEGIRRQMMGANGDVTGETRDAWNVNVSFVYSF